MLLVLYTLPPPTRGWSSWPQRYALLSTLGLEIVAVPSDAEPDALRRLGDARIFYPVVTEGARDILGTYRLFSTPRRTSSSSSTGRATCGRRPGEAASRDTRSAGRRSAAAERGEGAAAAGRARALMRVWKAVLLMNLALALGLGVGWLWWGRQAQRLAQDLEAARVAAVPTGEREFGPRESCGPAWAISACSSSPTATSRATCRR